MKTTTALPSPVRAVDVGDIIHQSGEIHSRAAPGFLSIALNNRILTVTKTQQILR